MKQLHATLFISVIGAVILPGITAKHLQWQELRLKHLIRSMASFTGEMENLTVGLLKGQIT